MAVIKYKNGNEWIDNSFTTVMNVTDGDQPLLPGNSITLPLLNRYHNIFCGMTLGATDGAGTDAQILLRKNNTSGGNLFGIGGGCLTGSTNQSNTTLRIIGVSFTFNDITNLLTYNAGVMISFYTSSSNWVMSYNRQVNRIILAD